MFVIFLHLRFFFLMCLRLDVVVLCSVEPTRVMGLRARLVSLKSTSQVEFQFSELPNFSCKVGSAMKGVFSE